MKKLLLFSLVLFFCKSVCSQVIGVAISYDDVICNGDNSGGIFIEASGGTEPYIYSIDNGVTFQSSNVFVGLVAGLYTILVEDAIGAQTYADVLISEPLPIEIEGIGVSPSCYGDFDGYIKIESVIGGNLGPYYFSIEGGTSFFTDTIVSFLASGTYTVIATDPNGCQGDTTFILNTEMLNGTITQIDGSLIVTSNYDNIEYQWFNCVGGSHLIIEDATNQSYTPTENGDYAVQVINEFGCVLLTQCFNISSVAINENHMDSGIEIFPNPVTDDLSIHFENKFENVQIAIRDVNGRILMREELSNPEFASLPVGSVLSEGVYFIDVLVGQKKWTSKILKL